MKFTGADTANELFSAHEIGDDADSVFFNVSRGGEVGKEGPEREGGNYSGGFVSKCRDSGRGDLDFCE